MEFGIEQAYQQAKDAIKVAALSELIEAKYKDNKEKFVELVAKPLGIVISENAKFSWELLKSKVGKTVLAKNEVKSFFLETICGLDKDSMIYRFVVGQPKLEKLDSLKKNVGSDRVDDHENVFFPNSGINDLTTLFSARKQALSSMKEIQENFSFSVDSPLVLPGDNAAAFAVQSLVQTLARMTEPLIGAKQFPQIVAFDEIDPNTGALPPKGPNNPLQFVMMPDLPYDDKGRPDKAFLKKLIAFRKAGNKTFLESTEFLAYADVCEKKYANPESAFDDYGMKPTPLMRKAVIDIHNLFHEEQDEDDEDDGSAALS